ncbi:MAG TPA: superoxide dismutase family protein [Longimicrobiaceae bacterium]|nr:superoxide dismutase family protein [Longimicrobiaceae bacterium]
MRRTAAVLTSLAAGAWLAACGGEDEPGETAASPAFDSAAAAVTAAADSVRDTVDAPADTAGRAAATLRDAGGQEIGTLMLEQAGGMVRITGGLSGLAAGQHGIHLHAVGRCEPPFESAGPHWNPASRQHGLQNPQGPHAGDLANLDVSGDGIGNLDATVEGRLRGGVVDADGAAIVVHAGPDDNRTDPSGNSGARVACGVVQ